MSLSLIESLANAMIGLAVSWLATWLVLGYAPAQAVAVTLMFFLLSFFRAFALRELFRRWE